MSPPSPLLSAGLFLLLLRGLTVVNAATNDQACNDLLTELHNGNFPITGITQLNGRIILTTSESLLFNLPASSLHPTALYISRPAEPFPDDRRSILLQLTDTYLEVAHEDDQHHYESSELPVYQYQLNNLTKFRYVGEYRLPEEVNELYKRAFINQPAASTVSFVDLSNLYITKYTVKGGSFQRVSAAKSRYICKHWKEEEKETSSTSGHLIITFQDCHDSKSTPLSLSEDSTFLGFISNSQLYLFDWGKKTVKIIEWPAEESGTIFQVVHYTEIPLVQFFICADPPTDWLMLGLVAACSLLIIVGLILLIVWIIRRRKRQRQFEPKVEYLVEEDNVSFDLMSE